MQSSTNVTVSSCHGIRETDSFDDLEKLSSHEKYSVLKKPLQSE